MTNISLFIGIFKPSFSDSEFPLPVISLSQTPKNMFALLLVVRSGLSLQQLVELVCVLIPILRKRKKT